MEHRAVGVLLILKKKSGEIRHSPTINDTHALKLGTFQSFWSSFKPVSLIMVG